MYSQVQNKTSKQSVNTKGKFSRKGKLICTVGVRVICGKEKKDSELNTEVLLQLDTFLVLGSSTLGEKG